MPAPVMRLRSDEQLVSLFRAGHDDAFRVIHDRYRQRLSAYARQMLPRYMDAEDAMQDVFLRVYTGLRASDRDVIRLRPWLYRAAHNRCIDELRRPSPPPPEVLAEIRSPVQDPVAQLEERESLRRVLEHIGRLPEQQRSALLLRELAGAHYDDIAIALETTVSAVKSLLVRARITLARSLEARDTPCPAIREELALAHDRGARPTSIARAHLRDCDGCRDFREQLRGTSRQLKALVPTLGPIGVIANALGFGGAGGGTSAAGGAAVGGGGSAIGTGALASAGVLGGSHVATLVAAAVATAGGAVAIQNTVMTPSSPSANVPSVISGSGSSDRVVAASAASPQASAVGTPSLSGTHPTNPLIGSGSSGAALSTNTPPPAVGKASSPIRQPSITGTQAVSTPKAAPAGAIGHTSITGTDEVSLLKPVSASQNGGTAAGGSSSGSSSGSGSGSGSSSSSSGSTTSTTESSQASTTGSSPTTSTSSWGDSAPPTSSSSSSSSDSSQTTSADSSSDSSSWNTAGTDAASNGA